MVEGVKSAAALRQQKAREAWGLMGGRNDYISCVHKRGMVPCSLCKCVTGGVREDL